MWLAVGSGLLGALAAAVGKLSLSPESVLAASAQAMCSQQPHINPGTSHCSMLSLSVRAGGFLAMLGLNAGMMKLLLQALTKGNTAYVTLSATSANFIVSVSAQVGGQVNHDICIGNIPICRVF